jgi:transposase-like protein
MKKRHTEEQIIAILREVEGPGAQLAAVCRKHNISPHTFAR